ncbi:GIY-YIG nuclease family protein [Flocculibacter collagenilyticus]|uniref:GIY-YIG nuclease family protein n=1 Tax=Flocculibacter collagenilyticus TaxID=2744479 RepID=UPI0018F51281|nr:GIY-YIG nuclease family protein [Flocculibacter collagenilyticus]
MNTWYLYLIRCRSNTLYTGITTDVKRRFAEHQSGSKKGAKYLKGKGPLQLVFSVEVGSKSQACKAEIAVKRLTKSRKEYLIKHPKTWSILSTQSADLT